MKSTFAKSTAYIQLFYDFFFFLQNSAGGANKRSTTSEGGNKIEKYCQYPASGTSTVSVTQEDYFCLEDESFLNDVIIDFYFKWIQHEIIPAESREKTHIFTTYFYKRLTTRPAKSKNKLHPIGKLLEVQCLKSK